MTYFIVKEIKECIMYLESYNTISSYKLEINSPEDSIPVGSIIPICTIDSKNGKQQFVCAKDDLPIELFNFEYLN